jgi:hypothetical protein
MKVIVLVIHILHLVLNSYIMLPINGSLQVELVRGWAILVQTSSALKKAILKDTVSIIMIQPFVKQLEISVMQMVL